jgi:hypothetical protein
VYFNGKKLHITGIILIGIMIFLSGCAQLTPEEMSSTLLESNNAPQTEKPEGLTFEPSLTEEWSGEAPDISSPLPENTQVIAQNTPAPTLSDWRDAPISPETISDRVIDIYQQGQVLGRNPLSFSVIGDCQAIPYVFLGPFSRGELEPGASESQLWNAINAFVPSFKRWAVTARGGFTAASILNPLQADRELCKPGETPLTCEFRLNNPAFVFITLETWLDPDTIDRYETYLRMTVEAVIERGAVPILLTKADSSELRSSKHVINPVIVNIAYEYQLPLVNFWRAAQYLENYGIDPEREGFHLSEAGYDLKNILALRALYQVWTSVEGINTGVVEEQPTPSMEPTQSSTMELHLPDCDENCIFFGTAVSKDGQVKSSGVYVYDVGLNTLEQILPEGYDLQDVSEDGQRLLVNQGARLYSVDLIDGITEIITETYNDLGEQGAYWDADDDNIHYLNVTAPIETDVGQAFNLIPVIDDEILYVEIGTCDGKDFCQSDGIYRQKPDGTLVKIDKFMKPVFSPDGSKVAYLNPDAATEENYGHIWYMLLEDTVIGPPSRQVLYFQEEPGFMVYPEVETYAFSPESDKLFILYNVYSEYYRYSLRLQAYLYDYTTRILYDYEALDGVSGSLSPRVVWSPDGNTVCFFLTDLSQEGEFIINLYQTDLISGEKFILEYSELINSEDYLYLTNLYWR